MSSLSVIWVSPGMPVEYDAPLAVIVRNDDPVMSGHGAVDRHIVTVKLVYDEL